MPREGRDHGSLAASQVGGARPGRRGAHPARDHARRAAALGRPGHVHGALQRDRRDDRRRDRLPPRAGQLPLRRRRRVRRDLAERAAREARPEGVGEAVDRPAPQRRRPGPGEPGAPEEDRVDAADADLARGSQVVPVHGRSHRHVRRDPDRRLAHGLHGRARLRGLVPSLGRAGGVGRDLVGRRGARPDAARSRGARHPAHRVGPDLRRATSSTTRSTRSRRGSGSRST